jgi:hypothetical protein
MHFRKAALILSTIPRQDGSRFTANMMPCAPDEYLGISQRNGASQLFPGDVALINPDDTKAYPAQVNGIADALLHSVCHRPSKDDLVIGLQRLTLHDAKATNSELVRPITQEDHKSSRIRQHDRESSLTLSTSAWRRSYHNPFINALKEVSLMSAWRIMIWLPPLVNMAVMSAIMPRTMPSKAMIAPTVIPMTQTVSNVRVERCHRLCTAIPPKGNRRTFPGPPIVAHCHRLTTGGAGQMQTSEGHCKRSKPAETN